MIRDQFWFVASVYYFCNKESKTENAKTIPNNTHNMLGPNTRAICKKQSITHREHEAYVVWQTCLRPWEIQAGSLFLEITCPLLVLQEYKTLRHPLSKFLSQSLRQSQSTMLSPPGTNT
eukprot:TRINITY_DN3517_c1_g1_i1.p1 TRINITY_DN3517_c1_g1~~TRINITY_DN3517_c1_g1_i1.p1  ORF type:complete len:119 (-),score=3.31 TRINITY_DN3517_c1_g1_i1:957-1313(-)